MKKTPHVESRSHATITEQNRSRPADEPRPVHHCWKNTHPCMGWWQRRKKVLRVNRNRVLRVVRERALMVRPRR